VYPQGYVPGGEACWHWAALDSQEQVKTTGWGCYGSLGANAGHTWVLRQLKWYIGHAGGHKQHWAAFGSDMSLWNMHKGGHLGGDFGGPPGAQPSALTYMSHWFHAWFWPECESTLEDGHDGRDSRICSLLIPCNGWGLRPPDSPHHNHENPHFLVRSLAKTKEPALSRSLRTLAARWVDVAYHLQNVDSLC